MGVPGLSCSPGVGICACDPRAVWPMPPPFRQRGESRWCSTFVCVYFLLPQRHLQEGELLL